MGICSDSLCSTALLVCSYCLIAFLFHKPTPPATSCACRSKEQEDEKPKVPQPNKARWGGSWENMRNILGLGGLRALDEFRKGDVSKCLTC